MSRLKCLPEEEMHCRPIQFMQQRKQSWTFLITAGKLTPSAQIQGVTGLPWSTRTLKARTGWKAFSPPAVPPMQCTQARRGRRRTVPTISVDKQLLLQCPGSAGLSSSPRTAQDNPSRGRAWTRGSSAHWGTSRDLHTGLIPLIFPGALQSILFFCPADLFHRSLSPTALGLGNEGPHAPQTHFSNFSSKRCVSQSYTAYFSYPSWHIFWLSWVRKMLYVKLFEKHAQRWN